jgi:hypothetical protein
MIVIVLVRRRLNGRESMVALIADRVDDVQHHGKGLNPTLVLERARFRLRRCCDQQKRNKRLHEPEEEAIKVHEGGMLHIAIGMMQQET